MCLKIVLRARDHEKGDKTRQLAVSRSNSDLAGSVERAQSAQPQAWPYQDTARFYPYDQHQDAGLGEPDWTEWLKLSSSPPFGFDGIEPARNQAIMNVPVILDTQLTHNGRDRASDACVSIPAQNHRFPVEDFANDPLSSPKISALPLAIRRTSMPDVTPFAQFCKIAPPSPSLESSRSSSLDNMKTAIGAISERSSCDLEVVSSHVPETRRVREPSLTPSPWQAAFEKESSQVLRGQGTGFEILRPGSLKPASSASRKDHSGPRNLMSALMLQRHRRRSIDSIPGSQGRRRGRISWLFH